MRNQSKNRQRKEQRRIKNENKRLTRQLAVACDDHFVYPRDVDTTALLGGRDVLLLLFIFSVAVALLVR